MDHNTLWFIANGMARPVGPQGPKPYKSGPQYATAPPGPCFDCGGDHWVRDCPNPKRGRQTVPRLPPFTRYCANCGIKHLVLDFPMNLEVTARAPTTLNIIKVWPSAGSPSLSETDIAASVQVVTRARARELKEENEDERKKTTPSESTNFF